MKQFIILLILMLFLTFAVKSQESSTELHYNYTVTHNVDKSISFNFTDIKIYAEDVERLREIFLKIDELVKAETKSLRESRVSFGSISGVEITLYRFGVNSFVRLEKDKEFAYLYIEEGQKYIDYLKNK